MPPAVFPHPKFHAGPSEGPGFALRVRTRWRRNRLDEELALGADPVTSAELELRADQLRSDDGRRRLANALVEALGDARGPSRGALGALRMKKRRQHDAIGESADDLLALERRLRDEPVDVRGVAMAALLVNDGASPLYRNSAEDLQYALRAARIALDAAEPAGHDVARAA